MSRLNDEEKAALRGLSDSKLWPLLNRLADSVKGDYMRGANARSYINGVRVCDDSDRLMAMGAAQGIDGFVNFIEQAIKESETSEKA